jgi:hypothetical protein
MDRTVIVASLISPALKKIGPISIASKTTTWSRFGCTARLLIPQMMNGITTPRNPSRQLT